MNTATNIFRFRAIIKGLPDLRDKKNNIQAVQQYHTFSLSDAITWAGIKLASLDEELKAKAHAEIIEVKEEVTCRVHPDGVIRNKDGSLILGIEKLHGNPPQKK